MSTGRGPAILGDVRDMFPFDGFVTFNGQLVLERDGTVLRRAGLLEEDVLTLVERVRKAGWPGMVLGEVKSWPLLDTPEVRRHYDWAGEPFPGLYDVGTLGDCPIIQATLYKDAEEAEGLLGDLREAVVVACGPGMVDIVPRDGGKDRGLQAVAGHYGFAREETAAFGDGMNDLAMVAWAGTGVAMGNGAPELKAAADYVTAGVAEDGVAKALVHLGMISEDDLK